MIFFIKMKVTAIFNFVRKNPHMVLAASLFTVGVLSLSTKVTMISGALFGAGASLLGAWVTELNNRRSNAEDKVRREVDARRYLAPELNRTIERVLYIHQRAIPNFAIASAGKETKTNDLQEDFIPYMPVLYPNAPQFRDLPGEDATALITFYDSLHALHKFVSDWWGREGQLPVNIFNMILTLADKSMALAKVCIQRFELEQIYPPQYELWGTLSSRIERSMEGAKQAQDCHIARFETKNQKPN
ncbi:hypothetical protein RGU70_17650 [Herbaspirillum sp. RTI4]|uniref:hypothetical protein n=1 Tax=Herbaspirillum sp. RTI4 TaxID=3048640 RepID=UPI002AB40AA6|nr:hypothetical protein [Herbaspirillum sp. RTI4]MDY7580138.1 hypothetical protein [Herbaspirillum sp. RTI4]MEA9983265.1 hypothetical protein [Herbaspirillum sp. RTI4]